MKITSHHVRITPHVVCVRKEYVALQDSVFSVIVWMISTAFFVLIVSCQLPPFPVCGWVNLSKSTINPANSVFSRAYLTHLRVNLRLHKHSVMNVLVEQYNSSYLGCYSSQLNLNWIGDSQWSAWSIWSERSFDTYEDSMGHIGFDIAICKKTNITRQRDCRHSMKQGQGMTCSGT